MKYKLIAMDFDGTLLTVEKKVTSYTKEVLLKYKNKGYVIVGVTARTLESVKSVVDINMFDYLILNNGSYVYDVKNSTGKYEAIISKEDAKDITEKVKKVSTRIDYCSGSFYYSYKNESINKPTFIIDIKSIEEVEEDIAKMNIRLLEQDKAKYYCDFINSNYSNLNSFIMQGSNDLLKLLVVNPKGINKGNILRKLGKELKIDLEEMIFFGDGTNDVDAMQLVGCSVAMGNALEDIKKLATYTTLSNNEDGIAVFLNKFLK